MSKTFTTSRGVTVEGIGIANLIDRLQAAHPMPKPPKYSTKTLGGGVEYFDHDETTLKTDEDKAQWAEYIKAKDKAFAEYKLAEWRLFLLYGMKVEMPQDDAWVKRQEKLGISVPTDPDDRRIHWIETEVLGAKNDYHEISLCIFEASGVSEEVLAEIAALFRGQIQRNTTSGTGKGDTAQSGNVDAQSTVRASENSDKTTNATVKIRRDG